MRIAKNRFAKLPNFTFSVVDYARSFPSGRFDTIVSALSIHHLEEAEKARLYRNVFKALPGGGRFVNLDQFNARTPEMNGWYDRLWLEHIETSGLPESEYAKWTERRKLDRENTVPETARLLESAGFATVECVYAYLKFAVVMAVKA